MESGNQGMLTSQIMKRDENTQKFAILSIILLIAIFAEIIEMQIAEAKKELFTALVNEKGWEGAGVMVNIAGEDLVVFGVKYEE